MKKSKGVVSGLIVLGLFVASMSSAEQSRAATDVCRAFLVGLQDYGGSADLKYAVDDMTALGEKLKELGFEITPYLNRRLTATQLLEKLEEFLEACPEGTTVVFAFSGHGGQDPETKKNVLIPLVKNSYESMGDLPLEKLFQTLEGTQGGGKTRKPYAARIARKIVILDACRGDDVTENSAGSSFTPAGTTKFMKARAPATTKGARYASLDGAKSDTPPKNTMVLYSSTGGKPSYEDEGLKHGVFLNFLIGAIAGGEGEQGQKVSQGDELDGKVAVKDVFKLAQMRTKSHTNLSEDGPQEPLIQYGEFDGDDFYIGTRRLNFSNRNLAEDWKYVSRAELKKLNFRHAKFNGAVLSGLDLSHLDFGFADFSGATLVNTNFTRSKLGSAKLVGADCRYINFTDANIASVNADRANFDYAKFVRTGTPTGFHSEGGSFNNIEGRDPRKKK